jgi:AcrR family transcriptional regulator
MTCSRRKLLSRAQRQATILQGAATAFATKGFASTGMEEVAAASGISKEIVYRHFASKDELYRAVLDATVQTLQTEFAGARQQFQSGVGIRALLAVGRASPHALRLLLVHAAREPEFADYAHDVRARVISWVLQRRGHSDPLFRRWAVEVAVSHTWNAVLTWLDLGDPSRDEEFARRCLAGVNALWEAWNAPVVEPTDECFMGGLLSAGAETGKGQLPMGGLARVRTEL